MKNRIRLALKLIFGKNIIIYEENTKIVKMIINGNLDIFANRCNLDYAVDKCIYDNYGELRYLGGKSGNE